MAEVKLSQEDREKIFRMLWWLKRQPVHAAYLLFGIKLSPHERITYREMHTRPNLCNKLSRGMAKTFLDALYLDQTGLLNSGSSQVSLGRGFRTGKLVLKEAEKIVEGSLASQEYRGFARYSLKDYKRIINRDPDLWHIDFSHGATIVTGPLGQQTDKTSDLRGIRANTTLNLDESADIDWQLFNSVIMPFTRVARNPVGGANAKIDPLHKIESGTIRYDWQRYTKVVQEHEKKMLEGDTNYGVVEFNYEDAFHRAKNHPDGEIIYSYRLNLEQIMEELESGNTSMEDFYSENKNVVQYMTGTEFSPQLVESVVNVELKPEQLNLKAMPLDTDDLWLKPLLECKEPCVIGLDPARESADAAFVVIRLGSLCTPAREFSDIIFAKTFFQAEFSVLANYVRELLERYSDTRLVYIDQGGGGSAVRDLLWRPEGGSLPLYDPTDENTPVEVIERGISNLRLDPATNENNTLRANFLKGQMQLKKLLIPSFELVHNNSTLADVHGTIRRLTRQLTYVKSSPSGAWKKYEVERGLKKDLFSALLLAMQGVKDLSEIYQQEAEVENSLAWVTLG